MKKCPACKNDYDTSCFRSKSGRSYSRCTSCRKAYTDKRRADFRARSVCICCGGLRVEGRTTCLPCSTRNDRSNEQRMDDVRSRGLCRWCKKVPAISGRRTCEPCVEIARDSNNRFRARRLSQNLCQRCGKNPRHQDGGKLCESCRTWVRQLHRLQRQEVIERYGGVCNCCGENNPYFLNIDHVNNDGGKHRRRAGGNRQALLEILNTPYDPDRYQLLCSNCNGAKEHYGSCPHTWSKIGLLGDITLRLRRKAS